MEKTVQEIIKTAQDNYSALLRITQILDRIEEDIADAKKMEKEVINKWIQSGMM